METKTDEDLKRKIETVRYAKKLNLAPVARLGPQAQNVFSLLLAKWAKEKEASISLPLTPVKSILGLSDQTDSYVDAQVKKLSRAIVKATAMEYEDEDMAFVAVLVPYIQLNKRERSIEATCLPQFLDVFIQLSAGYVEYKNTLFIKCRSKYAKNLFRIFTKNFKGSCTLSVKDLKEEMGISERTSNAEILRIIRRSIKELLGTGIFEKIEDPVPIYLSTRGRALDRVAFKYVFNNEAEAEMAGQGKIPGLDGAEGPSHQAPTAAPSGDPGGDPVPFAAEEPPFTADDVPAGHTDPQTGLYIPSQEELDARHLSEPKQSWRPAYSKPDIPETPPKCPKCGGEMIKRNAKSDGHEFWGCANFPRCRGTRDLDGTDTSKK